MNFLEKVLNKVFGFMGVVGFILMTGGVGSMDYNAEVGIPDDPKTYVLVAVGFVMLILCGLYNEITGAWVDISIYEDSGDEYDV